MDRREKVDIIGPIFLKNPKEWPMSGPLADLIVVDLTRVLAGPFCTLLLADMGARVIKVEQPESGDDSRRYGPFVNGKSGYFVSQNRGKESIALDLKRAADKTILHRLLRRADILVENFRPGAMARLGLGFAELSPLYPRLIYASTSGFGQTGPYAQRPAYDIIAQAMGGIMSLTGHGDGVPVRVGASIGDLGAGLFTALGILAALNHRARTGRGMAIDVAMLDSQVALLENAIARYLASGKPPEPLGARHSSIAPFEPYRSADGYIVIACGNDALFRRLAAALDRPDLAEDPRFIDNHARSENVLDLKAALETILIRKTTAAWLDILLAAGIPSAPINTIADVLDDPQIRHRQLVLPIDDPALPDFRVAGSPIKFSDYAEARIRPAAPDLDADRARILTDFPE